MTIRNTSIEYGSVAKFFHWLIFLLVTIALAVGFLMDSIKEGSPIRGTTYNLHKLAGLTILILMLMRFGWMLINPKPLLPPQTTLFEKIAERAVHWSFYLLLIAMPIVGWIFSTAAGHPPTIGSLALPLPGVAESKATAKYFAEVHESLAWVIIGLISIHVAAALKHHFVDRDNILMRMMPRKRIKS